MTYWDSDDGPSRFEGVKVEPSQAEWLERPSDNCEGFELKEERYRRAYHVCWYCKKKLETCGFSVMKKK